MIEKEVFISLPEGDYCAKVQLFDESDKPFLYDCYCKWRLLCEDVKKLHSRTINIPEGLTEGAFCIEMNALRLISGISGANSSFDCYMPLTAERIQVKASSVADDLTSFGPKSQWDKLYFLDFYREGKWDGTFNIYDIHDEDIYDQMLSSGESFTDQQEQGRRPRFSIQKSIIRRTGLKPVKTGCLK